MFQYAIELANQGFHVFPLKPGTKRPMFKAWESMATTDPEQIARWWTATPNANIGIACGPSNLLVIDLDKAKKPGGPRHGQETLLELAAGRELPHTLTVASARGGRHLYFLQPDGVTLRNTAGSATAGLGQLIDTRGHGGFIVAPGSVFEGASYRVEHDTAVAPLPGWIVDELGKTRSVGGPLPEPVPTPAPVTDHRRSAYGTAALSRSVDAVATASEGTRNDTLNREAFRMGRLVGGGVLLESAVTGKLRRAAAQAGLSPGEAANTIASGLAAGVSHPRFIPERDSLPRVRPQRKDDVMVTTNEHELGHADQSSISRTVAPPTAVPQEAVTEPVPSAGSEDTFDDIWSDLRSSFAQVQQVLREWTDHHEVDALEPAMDEASTVVAQAVLSHTVSEIADHPSIEAHLAPVDVAYAEAHSAGISVDDPEWTGISAIRSAVYNLWDTIKAVSGRYWAELSADMRVLGPLNALTTRAARGIADLADRAAARIEERGVRPQTKVDSLANLREAYISARSHVHAHAATHEWQRIAALWGTVNTLARQVDDPGIRAVVARSADAIADYAETLGPRTAYDIHGGAAAALASLAAAAENHARSLRAADSAQQPATGPRRAPAAQQGVEAQSLQARAQEVARHAQARLGRTRGLDAAPHNPKVFDNQRVQQAHPLRCRQSVSPQEPARGPRW